MHTAYSYDPEGDKELAQRIKAYRVFVRTQPDEYNYAGALCCMYNDFTSPYIMRTDRQHRAARAAARFARRRLETKYPPYVWKEDNNGYLTVR